MDELAFDHFVARSSRRLLRAAWLMTSDWPEAEDLVRNVFVLAWKQWPRVSTADSPDAYVQGMLANSFVSSRRRVRWAREVITDDLPDRPGPPGQDPEVRRAVAAALESLAPRQRAVLILRYFCDLTIEQTAAALGCSTGNVKSQTSRALGRLEGVAALRELREDVS